MLQVAFMPLALALFLNRRKAARLGLLPRLGYHGSITSVRSGFPDVDSIDSRGYSEKWVA